jgi:hypothetical protein
LLYVRAEQFGIGEAADVIFAEDGRLEHKYYSRRAADWRA